MSPASHRLLRLETVTPANLGSAAGEATLDRPTQKDAQTGLPFIPDSALKGVLAAHHDSPGDRQRRERLFGSADQSGPDGAPGQPGSIVIGNGELLCFPVPCSLGPAWVFPAPTIAWALRFGPATKAEGDVSRLLASLETPRVAKVFAWPVLPRLETYLKLEPVQGATVEKGKSSLLSLLRHLAGPALPEDTPLLVVAGGHASFLWQAAAESRALVALNTKTKTVSGSALRQVELIPPGSVFLSLISYLAEETEEGFNRSEGLLFQAGAWEGLGLGWLRAVPVAPQSGEPKPLPPSNKKAFTRSFDRSSVMVEAHRAVAHLDEHVDAVFHSKVRTVTRGFGGRAQFSGLEAAFAFELAKAKPAHPKPSVDARAHRWLLEALLDSPPPSFADAGPSGFLLKWLDSDPFAPGKLASQRDLILTRWLWLARYLDVEPMKEEP